MSPIIYYTIFQNMDIQLTEEQLVAIIYSFYLFLFIFSFVFVLMKLYSLIISQKNFNKLLFLLKDIEDNHKEFSSKFKIKETIDLINSKKSSNIFKEVSFFEFSVPTYKDENGYNFVYNLFIFNGLTNNVYSKFVNAQNRFEFYNLKSLSQFINDRRYE